MSANALLPQYKRSVSCFQGRLWTDAWHPVLRLWIRSTEVREGGGGGGGGGERR